MKAPDVAKWMLGRLHEDGCLYQDDVVDHLVKSKSEDLLRENSQGNQVLARPVLTAFRKLTPDNVVWVRPNKYWRFRVREDEPGREARG
jgi:hypothetical protein